MAEQFAEPVPFDVEHFPIGSWVLGTKQIHRVDEYVGAGGVKVSSWDTLVPEDIDVDHPVLTNRLIPATSKPQTRIDTKRIGAKLKAAAKTEALENISSMVNEVEGVLTSTPKTVGDLIDDCPSFADLEPDAAANRMDALLSILVNEERAVATDDGYVAPVSAAVETAPDEDEPAAVDEPTPAPADEPEPEAAPAADDDAPATKSAPKPRQRRTAKPEMPLPQVAAATAMEPLAATLHVDGDPEVAAQTINPSWLFKDVDASVIDEGLSAITFIGLHLLASGKCSQLADDSLIDLVREVRDLRTMLSEG